MKPIRGGNGSDILLNGIFIELRHNVFSSNIFE